MYIERKEGAKRRKVKDVEVMRLQVVIFGLQSRILSISPAIIFVVTPVTFVTTLTSTTLQLLRILFSILQCVTKQSSGGLKKVR